MDVAKEIAEIVRKKEEMGLLPAPESQIDALVQRALHGLAKKGGKIPPPGTIANHISGFALMGAAFTLYDYFDGSMYEDKEDAARKTKPYVDRVDAAWKEGRNKQSIRLLSILYEERKNMLFYWSDDARDNLFTYLRAAQYLGIENDWPELLPARPEMQPQESESSPQYSPSSDPYPAGYAARTGQIQNDITLSMMTGNLVSMDPSYRMILTDAGPRYR